MDASGHQRWLRAAILIGIVFLVVGLTFAALGLLELGKPVEVVTDAIAALNSQAADKFFTDLSVGKTRGHVL